MRRLQRRARRPRMTWRAGLLTMAVLVSLFAAGCWLAGLLVAAAA